MRRPGRNDPKIADFFAQGYRVSGSLTEDNLSLSDVIYDPSTNYLVVRDAYLSPITAPAKISAYYATTTLVKANLDFVIVMDQNEGLRLDQHYKLGNYSFEICLTVPFFEIQGRLHSFGRTFDPRTYFSSEAGSFITLLDVTARCTFDPDVSYQGGAALISRQSVGFLGEQKQDVSRG